MVCAFGGAPARRYWEVLYVDAFHNDPAGPACQWWFWDQLLAGYQAIGDLTPLASGVRRGLYGAHFPGKLYVAKIGDLMFQAPAGATAGCRITMNLIMREKVGVF
jgi:hypothetical protein